MSSAATGPVIEHCLSKRFTRQILKGNGRWGARSGCLPVDEVLHPGSKKEPHGTTFAIAAAQNLARLCAPASFGWR